MKKLLLLLSILFCVLFAKAQNLQTERDSLKRMAKSAMMASKSAAVGGGSSSAGLAPVSMPIMPSPTAASLVRNATASPNLYTGAVNVSVPLYTLPAQGMNVPVGLVYQSNGVKVNDKNGPLGMTWSLQGGGAVARIVRGYPDEFKGKMTKEIWLESAPDRKEKQEVQISGFWYNTIPTNYKTKIESFNQIIDRSEGKDEKLWDTEPDKYLFSAPGLTGSFYIPEKGKKPIIHCDADIDIQTFIVDGALRGFVITTSSGLCYEFGMQKNYLEKQSFATESKISEARFKRMKGKFYETKYSFEEAIYTKTYLDEKNKYPSTWYLKKIITPYSTDAIYYKYQSDEDKEEEQAKSIDTHYDNSFNDYYFANRSKSNIRVNRYPKDKDYLSQVFTSKQTTTKIYAPKRLTSIASSTGKVVLVYTDDKNRSIKQVRIFGIDKKTLVKSYHLRYTEEINKVIEPLYPSLTKYYTARGRSFAGSRRISSNVSKKGSSSRKFLMEIYEINKTNSDSIQAFKFQYHNPELLPEFCSQFQNQYGLYVNYPNFKSQFYIKENSTCYPMLALDENKSNGSRGGNISVNQIVGIGTPNLDDNGSNLIISDSTVVNGMLISMQNATGALTKFIYDATFEGAKLKQAITFDGANKVQAIDYKYENPIQPLGFSSRQYKVGEYKTGISPWGRTEQLLTQGAPYGFEKSTVTTNGVKNTSYFTTANTYNNKLAASTSYQEVIEGVNVANGRTGGYDEDERDRYDFYTFKKFLDILTNLYKYEVLDALRKYNGEQNSYECVDFVLAELRKQQIYPSLDFYYERKKSLQTNFRHRVGRPTECDQLRGRVIKTETYNLKGEIASIQQFIYEKYDLNKNTTKKQAYVVSQSDYEANDVKYIVPYSIDYETLRLKSSKSTTYITKNEKTEKESTIESYSSIFPLIPEEVIEKNKNTGDVWKTKNFYVLFDDSNKSKTKMREKDIERDDDETGGGNNSTSLKYQAYPKYAIQKQEVFKNGKQFSGSQVIYDENTQLPKELQTWIKENYETTLTYDKFDYKRRILQAHGRDGIPTAYRYKGNFIDLTAQNATYDEISNGKAEDLRKKLKKAMIASANYSPAGFLTDQTDANGYTLYYEYDDFGRLKLLRDHDQNIVEAYDYQYGKVGQEKVSEEKLGIGQMVLGETFVVGGYTKSKMEGLPSAGKNYIASYGFKKEKATFNDRNNVDKANTAIEYQDGLGRPTQQIAVNSLPQGYSVVQAFEYDSLGRQAVQYRSLPMLGDSKYKKDWKQYLQDRYENTYKAESSYDAFNRVNKQGSFGEEYALSKRPKITHYGMNQAAVESYTIDLNSEQFKKKTYTKGTLIKTAVYYEGITNVVYKNMNGQVVRKGAVQGNQQGDVDHNSGLLTDYVYDDYGNLRAILPPQAKGDITKKEYVYKFHYDERQRLVKKEIPGAGSITMQYDELDRLVRETDAKGVTSYIKYDELSRPVETGYFKKQSAVSDQHSAGKETVLSRTYYDNYEFNFAKANSCSTEHAESNLGRITGSEIRVLGTDTWIKAVSYYDKEGRVIEAISQNNTDGTDRVTSSYNFEGKVTETHVSKTFNGKKYSSKREYDYGKAGELLNVHHGVNGQNSIVLSSFRYNKDGSLAEKRLHNGSIKTNYTYDELDRMVKARSKKLFELELAYDSSLKGANNQFYYDGSLSAMAWKSKNKKRYTYSFDYDKWKNLSAANSTDHPYTTEYHYDRNGNMDWLKRRDSLCTEPGDVYQHFEYKYEGTNQLKKLWRKNTELVEVWPGDSNNDGKVDVDDQHPVGYNYKLKAKARDTRSTAWKAYMAIQRKGDDLVFSDTDGNGKINELDTIAIHQNMLKTHEIAEATATKPFSYKYDDNGNMVYDEYKKLHISYNILNLPDTLSVTGQGKIVNQYLADGTLLRRSFFDKDDNELRRIDYQGEFLFVNGKLDKVFTKEGYYQPASAMATDQSSPPKGGVGGGKRKVKKSDFGTYYYTLKDHLGHTRVVVDEEVNVIQETAYYPYGGIIAGLSTKNKYNYLYTGKEFIDSLGVNWYDHHARYYDPEVGRWFAIDPALQAASPYMAMGNNPMMMVDEDGEWFFAALAVGALIGAGSYTASIAFSKGGFDNWSWGGFFQSAGMGAVSGVATGGIGEIFGGLGGSVVNGVSTNSLGTQILNETGRALAHGVAQGGLGALQGDNFFNGFASGGLGSISGSGFQVMDPNFGKSAWNNTFIGVLSGGMGAELSGGDFWRGAGQGATVALLNHYIHRVENDLAKKNKTKKAKGPFPEKKGSPFIELELKLKIGLGYEEEFYIFGIGEKLKASAAIDYMTFKLNENGFKYIPYQDVYLSGEFGVPLVSTNSTYSLFSNQFNPGGQFGLVEASRYSSPRINLFNHGVLFGGGYNLKLSLDFYKAANSVVKVHNQYEESLGSYPRPY